MEKPDKNYFETIGEAFYTFATLDGAIRSIIYEYSDFERQKHKGIGALLRRWASITRLFGSEREERLQDIWAEDSAWHTLVARYESIYEDRNCLIHSYPKRFHHPHLERTMTNSEYKMRLTKLEETHSWEELHGTYEPVIVEDKSPDHIVMSYEYRPPKVDVHSGILAIDNQWLEDFTDDCGRLYADVREFLQNKVNKQSE